MVIPTYNRASFVLDAVASVLAQTFRNFEVIVVDDGSTDSTVELLERAFGSRIRLEKLPRNEGRSVARNVGWALARGEYVAFLDSDDIWLPEKLERQMPLFQKQGVSVTHTWVGKMDLEGKCLEAETAELRKSFAKACARGYDYGGITETWCRMYTSAVVVRREVLRQTGGFDPRLAAWEDWDVLWRAAREGEVATLAETLVLHRKHEGNTATTWRADAVPWLEVIRKHLAELEVHPRRRELRLARRNLQVNMALGEYWRRRMPESRKWMRRAIWNDPGLLNISGYVPWGAPLVHACFPRPVAAYLVKRWALNDYGSTE